MAADQKKTQAAAKFAETRERYRSLVPASERLDGLAPLHTLRVPYRFGRPVEFIPIVITSLASLMALGALVVFAGVPAWIAVMIAPIAGMWIGSGFFKGDGLKVKEPYLRKKLCNNISDVVVGGPLRPSSTRYEFVEGGKSVPWEEVASE